MYEDLVQVVDESHVLATLRLGLAYERAAVAFWESLADGGIPPASVAGTSPATAGSDVATWDDVRRIAHALTDAVETVDALVASRPGVFFAVAGYGIHPMVLLHVERASCADLEEAITDAWLSRGPRRLTRPFLARARRSPRSTAERGSVGAAARGGRRPARPS